MRSGGHREKTIDFKDLFQGGKAKYRHKIFEYPKQSGKWYILKCDEHNLHFTLKDNMSEAARHLNSQLHGTLPQCSDIAVNILGTRVLNCGAAEAEKNNSAFGRELKRGYQVLGEQPRRRQQRSSNSDTADHIRVRGSRSQTPSEPSDDDESDESESEDEQLDAQTIRPGSMPFCGDDTFEVGKVYLGLRPSYAHKHLSVHTMSKWSAIMVLPIAGSFETVGLQGSIYNTILTKKRTPVCFDRCKTTRAILGWAKGYEDGGPKAMDRKVPVLYFDDKNSSGPFEEELADTSLGYLVWQRLDSIRPLSHLDPEGRRTSGYKSALRYSQKLERRSKAGATAIARNPPRIDGDQRPRPSSLPEHRVSSGPGHRAAADPSRETAGAAERELTGGSESSGDADDGSDSGDSHYYTDAENNPSPQDYRDGGVGPNSGGPGLQKVTKYAARGMANDTESTRRSVTGGNSNRCNNMHVSYEFEPIFHRDTIVVGSTEPSSPGGTIECTETSDSTRTPSAEPGDGAPARPGREQADALINIVVSDQDCRSSPASSDSDHSGSPVREVLDEAPNWLRTISEELLDPPSPGHPSTRYRRSLSSTPAQTLRPASHEPRSSSSVGPNFRAITSQTVNRDVNTATNIARAASSLLARNWVGEPLARSPYGRNRMWQATVMDVEDGR